jgi:hypothetical protein
MSHAPRDPDTGNDDEEIGTPRWVKVFAAIAVVLALLFIIVHAAGGGLGRHMAS